MKLWVRMYDRRNLLDEYPSEKEGLKDEITQHLVKDHNLGWKSANVLFDMEFGTGRFDCHCGLSWVYEPINQAGVEYEDVEYEEEVEYEDDVPSSRL